jgi:TRAP transporter TAXI family solute receptor
MSPRYRPIALLATSLALAACASATPATPATPAGPALPAPQSGQVVIATGDTKGVYYQYAQAFATVAGRRLGGVRLLSTLGSVQNIQLLRQGRATFAISASDAAADGLAGRAPFDAPVPVRAVARLYDDYIHVVVRADAPIHVLADLRGHRVSVGPDASGTALIADRILSTNGIDPHRDIQPAPLSLADSVTALEAGRIDAFFWSGGLYTAGVTELAGRFPIRLIPLTDAATKLRSAYGSAYRVGTIPAGTYPGVDSPVLTVAVPNLLIALATTPADLVERVVAALFDSASTLSGGIPAVAQLDRRVAIFTGAIPLHDGAAAYYRSTKDGL